jgi:hypothetical protein
MCPACLAVAAALAVKAASAGGLAAYGVSKLRSKTKPDTVEPQPSNTGDAS